MSYYYTSLTKPKKVGNSGFVKQGSNKVKSIQILLDKLNKNRADLIAIGDGENDIDMLNMRKLVLQWIMHQIV